MCALAFQTKVTRYLQTHILIHGMLKICKKGHEFEGERCKVCAENYRNQYYRANSERFILAAKINRLENLERCKATQKQYYENNRDNLLRKERVRLEQKPWKYLCKYAKKRAKELGLPFELTEEYVKTLVPDDMMCPVIRIPLIVSKGHIANGSMTLDRLIPELGYVCGNVFVISHLANTIKNDCTDPAVLYSLADWLEAHLANRGAK